MLLNWGTKTTEQKESKPTERQYNFYVNLCNQKEILPESMESFTFKEMKEEIERLLSLASQKQINYINSLRKSVKEEEIEIGISFEEAQKEIERLQKLAPPSKRQLEKIEHMIFLNIIKLEDINEEITAFTISNLIGLHVDKFNELSKDRATYPQIYLVDNLQKIIEKSRGYHKNKTLEKVAHMEYEEVQLYIDELQMEINNIKEGYKLNEVSTGLEEMENTSRDREQKEYTGNKKEG